MVLTQLLGGTLAKAGRRTLSDGPGALGLSAGSAASINPKVWPCEDSVALVRDGSTLVATVADGHWGGASAELVAAGLEEAWQATGSLVGALRRLDAALWRTLRVAGDPSETTALLVRLAGRELSWASVGDSLLLVASRGELLLVNGQAPVGPTFLGRAPLAAFGDALEVDAGTLVLEPDAVVLLATDGLERDASGLAPAEIARILTGPGTPEARVERLLVAADGPAGGRDNLGVVLLAPQWLP